MPCEKTQHLRVSKDILKFDGDFCTALRDILLHKLQITGALSSFEEPLRYGYFWNQGVKLHHIGGCHFDSGLVTSLWPPLQNISSYRTEKETRTAFALRSAALKKIVNDKKQNGMQESKRPIPQKIVSQKTNGQQKIKIPHRRKILVKKKPTWYLVG